MLEKDEANLKEIVAASEKILRFTSNIRHAEELMSDDKTYDAVMMNFVLIGEAVSRLSENLKSLHAHIDWQNIKGFRNLVVHDYIGIDAFEVWSIITEELPVLIKDVRNLLV